MRSILARRKTATSISTSRWLGYATAAAATAALGHAQTAEAAVVVVQENETFNMPYGSSVSAARGAFALGSGGAHFGLSQLQFSNGKGEGGVSATDSAFVRGFSNNGFLYASKLARGSGIKSSGFGPFSVFQFGLLPMRPKGLQPMADTRHGLPGLRVHR